MKEIINFLAIISLCLIAVIAFCGLETAHPENTKIHLIVIMILEAMPIINMCYAGGQR